MFLSSKIQENCFFFIFQKKKKVLKIEKKIVTKHNLSICLPFIFFSHTMFGWSKKGGNEK